MKTGTIIAISIILLFGLFLHLPYISEYPNNMHAWAQSDRFSIALGFLRNGFDFFHPQTFTLNKQFPDNFTTPYSTAITAVDMPIHDYIVSLFMELFNTSKPIVFKVYSLIYSMVGMFFFFLLSRKITKSSGKAMIILAIALTSKVWIYYQDGFLPSIPSFANVVIGLWFYLEYLDNRKNKQIIFSIFFLSIAFYNRTPFAIPFIAILCAEGLRLIRIRKIDFALWISTLVSFSIWYAYTQHSNNLRALHGSLFLNYPLTPQTWEEFKEIARIVWDNRVFKYFNTIQYVTFIAFLIFGGLIAWKRKILSKLFSDFPLFLIIYLTGTICYTLLMFVQFTHHDYYFLDTLFLPVLLLVAYGIKFIPIQNRILITPIVIYFVIAGLIDGNRYQRQIRNFRESDMAQRINEEYPGSEEFLDSLNVPKDAKILVFQVQQTPNLALLYMNREGYVVLDDCNHLLVDKIPHWDWDYAVVQVSYINKLVTNYPILNNYFAQIGTNGKICVFERLNDHNRDLPRLNLLPAKNSIFALDYITPLDTVKNKIKPEKEYYFEQTIPYLGEIMQKNNQLDFHIKYHGTSKGPLHFITAVMNKEEEVVYYNSITIPNDSSDSLTNYSTSTILPSILPEYRFTTYLWNQGRNDLEIDSMRMEIKPRF